VEVEKEVMDDVLDIIQEIVKAKSFQGERLDKLVRELQSKRGTPGLPTTPLFFGIAKGIEKIAEDRIYHGQGDPQLDEITSKIEAIEEREGLEEGEHFLPDNPDTPEDYQAQSIEFDARRSMIVAEAMTGYGENDMAEKYLNNPMGYKRIYYAGWRVVEKDNPVALKVIDELQANDTEGTDDFITD
jgi:hypothetical protein